MDNGEGHTLRDQRGKEGGRQQDQVGKKTGNSLAKAHRNGSAPAGEAAVEALKALSRSKKPSKDETSSQIRSSILTGSHMYRATIYRCLRHLLQAYKERSSPFLTPGAGVRTL